MFLGTSLEGGKLNSVLTKAYICIPLSSHAFLTSLPGGRKLALHLTVTALFGDSFPVDRRRETEMGALYVVGETPRITFMQHNPHPYVR